MTYDRAKALMKRGLSRPTLYKVEIDTNDNNALFSESASEYLELFCSSASVPQYNYETVGAGGQDMVGVMRQQPAQVVYAKPFQIEVIERSDYLVYKQIKDWMDSIAPGSNSYKESSHRMKYYDFITCDITLKKFEYSQYASPTDKFENLVAKEMREKGYLNKQGYRTALKVRFRNAYPVSIGDISYGSELNNQMVRYTIGFTYETYDTKVPEFFDTEHSVDYDETTLGLEKYR